MINPPRSTDSVVISFGAHQAMLTQAPAAKAIAFARLIHKMEPVSQHPQRRNQRHADEQRGHETEK